jgi:hypothetical protein
LHAEQLQGSKERVHTGEAQSHKRVVTEMETMRVPGQREEVVLERDGEVTVVGPGGSAVSTAGGGVMGLWQRLRARPVLPLALSLSALAFLVLLGLRRSGRIGAASVDLRLRTSSRKDVRA